MVSNETTTTTPEEHWESERNQEIIKGVTAEGKPRQRAVDGISKREAARLLAESLTELLGEEVKPGALRRKAQRAERAAQSAPLDPTPEEHSESEQNQEIKMHRAIGGRG